MKARNLWVVALLAVVPLVSACAAYDPYQTHAHGTPPPGVVVEPSTAPATIYPPVSSPPPAVHQPATVVHQPGVVAAAIPATLEADRIEATEVRARVIYANRIEAPEIRGTVRSLERVRFESRRDDLRAAVVEAGAIYADRIVASRVMADNIYVRDLERR